MAGKNEEMPKVRITYERPAISFEKWREGDLLHEAYLQGVVESRIGKCRSDLEKGRLESGSVLGLMAEMGELFGPWPTFVAGDLEAGQKRSAQRLLSAQRLAEGHRGAIGTAFDEGLEDQVEKVWRNSLVSTFSPLARHSSFSTWEDFENAVLSPIDTLGYALAGAKLVGITLSESNKSQTERVHREFRASLPKYLRLLDEHDRVPWIRIDSFPADFWWRREHPLPMFSGSPKPAAPSQEPFEDGQA